MITAGRKERAEKMEKVDDMRWDKGIKRLTLVLSIIVGPLVFYSICIYTGDWPWSEFHYQILLSFELTGFISVWIIYFVMRWIIKGFCVDKTNDAKDNK